MALAITASIGGDPHLKAGADWMAIYSGNRISRKAPAVPTAASVWKGDGAWAGRQAPQLGLQASNIVMHPRALPVTRLSHVGTTDAISAVCQS